MLQHCINKCSWVCSSQHETYFTNSSMNYIAAMLFKLVCVDGKCSHITVAHKLASIITSGRVIKCAICINTFITILKQRMPKNVHRIVMIMIPHKRDGLTIIVLKCIFSDCSSVRASEVVLSSPATKIVFFPHFEILLLLNIIAYMTLAQISLNSPNRVVFLYSFVAYFSEFESQALENS